VLRRASRTPALRREVAVTVMAIGAAGCAGRSVVLALG